VIEDALGGEHLDLVLEETDSPSNLAAAGQKRRARVAQAEPPVERLSGRNQPILAMGKPATIAACGAKCSRMRTRSAPAQAAGKVQ